MRCLYCGKELALLKRWTSGGEFCSDAHRQRYQEEYNQLALNRLLQAKPREAKPQAEAKGSEAKTAAKPAEAKSPAPAASTKPVAASEPLKPAARAVETVPQRLLEPVPEPEPEAEVEPEMEMEPEQELAPLPEMEGDPAPAEAGFFIEMPVPATTGAAALQVSEADFDRSRSPLLPEPACEQWATERWGTELVAAGQVAFAPMFCVANYVARVSEGKLELREFVRAAPLVEFALRGAGATGIVERSEDPMDILFFPQPPPASPPLWNQGEQEFKFDSELGTLARMVFRTTGLEDTESGEVPVPVSPEPAASEPAAELQDAPPEPVMEPIPVPVASAPARPVTPVVVTPASPSAPSFSRPAARPAAHTEVQPAPEPAIKAQTAPVLATKPLPVTLHGLPAGRGKPVQVFPSAVSSGVDVQVPRSNALPLRPVMVLTPSQAPAQPVAPAAEAKEERKPADRTVLVKSDSKKQRPDPRLGNGKGRKSEPEPKVAVAAAVKEPEPENPRPLPVKESPKANFPAPRAESYTPPDLALPSLSLDAGGSFWSKLPLAGKAGVALVAALAISGAVFALSHAGSAKAGNNAPQIVEGPALSAVDSGWITDWGAEPGVRREHDISVLRPSMNLTDYRLQFEAQIDTKAIGWVYRAKDGKDYYVNKLEIVKSGLAPTVALVRFAVINGQEEPRTQNPLNLAVRLDTLYKVRFDAVGDRFTTYVQDQKVDEWTDDRLKTGGIGLYSERGERMSLKGSVNVVPLVIKK
jgi:hypothetical protein